jgi:hypothetical protein
MRKEEMEAGEVPDSERSCVRSSGLTTAEAERVRAMERWANAPDRRT